ncbi:trypsin inhibitor like cysteine rich domain-containing protein [Ditylenchus destructor]|uniref:Trypsin inhibitor like cysteine rich domain-containing protein n=1 Tax=Ditylenchus destructor TaxID=166010 RepID=A0AAD4R0D0_9BILA|nr:trypsin inhibitor like cysteine rich domain-containing protein [Ditylenchus destructor]
MGCVCPEGYARHPLNVFSPDCIPLAECPKCPPHEVYDDNRVEYGSCAPTCEQPGTDRPCYAVGCTTISCTCADGLVRNLENNKCIPVKECPRRGLITKTIKSKLFRRLFERRL